MLYSMKKIVLFLWVVGSCAGCGITTNAIDHCDEGREDVLLTIHEGLVSKKAQKIRYKIKGRTRVVVDLSMPIIVAQAEQEEKWGFFQFPSIGKADDGTLIVEWQMQDDSHSNYGKVSDRKYTPMMSKDNGLTWVPMDNSYNTVRRGYNVYLKDGGYLQVRTPQSRTIHDFGHFPSPVGKSGQYTYYLLDSLPDQLQGIYFLYRDKDNKSEIIHSMLYDPGVLRYAIDDQMPVVWWGNIKQLSDMSLVAGVYPAFYLDSLGRVMPGGVSFYHSEDLGRSWSILGKIPFCRDRITERLSNKSFDEPAFEILPDSTFLCVMRTGPASPLYEAFSYDRGKTWTVAKPFTPNGVKPQLLLLNNGVLVLASGRPGVQIRFSFDGSGQTWSEPIDMVPFMNDDGSFTRDVSCGYTSVIEADDNSFYLVWSDFTSKDLFGNIRKSIWFRKVSVQVE